MKKLMLLLLTSFWMCAIIAQTDPRENLRDTYSNNDEYTVLLDTEDVFKIKSPYGEHISFIMEKEGVIYLLIDVGNGDYELCKTYLRKLGYEEFVIQRAWFLKKSEVVSYILWDYEKNKYRIHVYPNPLNTK